MNEKDWKNIKSVNEWLDREDLPSGYTMANAKFRHDFNRLAHKLKVQNAYLYFIGVVMEVRYVTKMMWSAKKQSRFCETVAANLKEKRVETEHIKVFDDTVKTIEKRLETIERITREDIHLSKYEPFFKAEIYDKDLQDIDFEELKPMADKWCEEHQKEVDAHLKAIQPEIDRYEKFKTRKHEAREAEKKEKREKKKAETAYLREIRENRKKNRKAQERMDRSFSYLYK